MFIEKCIIYLFLFTGTILCSNITQDNDDDPCVIQDYIANCVLDVLDEHVSATAVINHCHIPIDITFRLVYRYGNDSEQRWQYTYVTSNQNERVLIPGLILPVAPEALVYLFARVPEDYFELQNDSFTAIEASFVAIISENEWEEIEFLNDVIDVGTTDDCFYKAENESMLWLTIGCLCGLASIIFISLGFFWLYKKRKLALENLALVNSVETGLPGAQPYQVMGPSTNNNEKNVIENHKKTQKKNQSSVKKKLEDKSLTITNLANAGFRFGRLKEEDEREIKAQEMIDGNSAVVIGNPVLISKSAMLQGATGGQTSHEAGACYVSTTRQIARKQEHLPKSRDRRNKVNESTKIDRIKKNADQYNWNDHPLESTIEQQHSTRAPSY